MIIFPTVSAGVVYERCREIVCGVVNPNKDLASVMLRGMTTVPSTNARIGTVV